MTSKATSAEQYLAELPDEQRPAVAALRNTILKNLPKGYQEVMQYGMLSYVVPHSLYPAGYHCDAKQPLPFMALAGQKNSVNFYHMGMYMQPELLQWFENEYPQHSSGKLDMGKSCVRFKKPEHIPHALIGQLVKKMGVKEWIALYESKLKK